MRSLNLLKKQSKKGPNTHLESGLNIGETSNAPDSNLTSGT